MEDNISENSASVSLILLTLKSEYQENLMESDNNSFISKLTSSDNLKSSKITTVTSKKISKDECRKLEIIVDKIWPLINPREVLFLYLKLFVDSEDAGND